MSRNDVGSWLIIISAGLAWAFVIAYSLMSPWYRSWAGRHLLVTNLVFALVLTTTVARILAGAALDTPWYATLRMVVFSGVPFVFASQLVLLFRSQQQVRRQERANRTRNQSGPIAESSWRDHD